MTAPSVTAFEVAGSTIAFALTVLAVLTIIGWLREAFRHELFLARMRQWARLDEPTLPPHSSTAGVGSSSSVASIRAVPPVRGADRRPDGTGGPTLLGYSDDPDAA